MRLSFLVHGPEADTIDSVRSDVAQTHHCQEGAMPPLRKPPPAPTYISDMLFQGIRVKDDEAAKLHLARLAKAREKQLARKQARRGA